MNSKKHTHKLTAIVSVIRIVFKRSGIDLELVYFCVKKLYKFTEDSIYVLLGEVVLLFPINKKSLKARTQQMVVYVGIGHVFSKIPENGGSGGIRTCTRLLKKN